MGDEAKLAVKSDLSTIPDGSWQQARERFAAIAPLLDRMPTRKDVELRAREVERNPTTLYRWLHLWRAGQTLSALVPRPRGSPPGANRLNVASEAIIAKNLAAVQSKLPRQSASRLFQRIRFDCRAAELPVPHVATIRRRLRAKESKKPGKPLCGSFPGANSSLAVVQIDHTKLDLIVVDEQERRPIGRPWLTLAIDVFSRVVVGSYLSLDSPGVHSVGLCVAQAVLPKGPLLAKFGLDDCWPVSGLMDVIHADNGRDFHSKALQRAAEEWGIDLQWRPVRRPWYGGHIERLIGTIAEELHQLPGTTFSRPDLRGSYDSEKHAAMTLQELERWLLRWITGVYHCRQHSAIKTTPLAKYQEGLRLSHLEPRLPFDSSKFSLDFMPFFERSVGRAGITIDGIHYWSDILRPWVEVRDAQQPSQKLRFVVRRDPRDISAVWLWDSEIRNYLRIPYRNLSHPAVSVWELREASRRARQERPGRAEEQHVFATYERLREEESEAARRTRLAKRNQSRRLVGDSAMPGETPTLPFHAKRPIVAFSEIEDI